MIPHWDRWSGREIPPEIVGDVLQHSKGNISTLSESFMWVSSIHGTGSCAPVGDSEKWTTTKKIPLLRDQKKSTIWTRNSVRQSREVIVITASLWSGPQVNFRNVYILPYLSPWPKGSTFPTSVPSTGVVHSHPSMDGDGRTGRKRDRGPEREILTTQLTITF